MRKTFFYGKIKEVEKQMNKLLFLSNKLMGNKTEMELNYGELKEVKEQKNKY